MSEQLSFFDQPHWSHEHLTLFEADQMVEATKISAAAMHLYQIHWPRAYAALHATQEQPDVSLRCWADEEPDPNNV
jgi:hypothetical protein